MLISLIAAMAENRVIGRNGEIPWDIPEDRRYFRQITWGHPVIMGRKTFESLGHQLPGRLNIVLTRRSDLPAAGCTIVHDLPSALAAAGDAPEVFIIGGGELFRETLPLAGRIYLTLVHLEVAGDVFFPPVPAAFREIERRGMAARTPCTILVYERTALHDDNGVLM